MNYNDRRPTKTKLSRGRVLFERLPDKIQDDLRVMLDTPRDCWLHVAYNDIEFLQHIEGRIYDDEGPIWNKLHRQCVEASVPEWVGMA